MKKLILSLFVLLFGIINFGYCDQVLPTSSWNGNHVYNGIFDYYSEDLNFSSSTKVTFNYQDLAFVCFKKKYVGGNAGNGQYSLNGVDWYNAFTTEIGCVPANTDVYFIGGDITFFYFLYGDGYVPKTMTKGECQVQYNLIPVEYVDQHYCETNDLCPEQNECTGTGGNLTGLDWSALFINNIQHPGKSIINVNIPDYITWDYSTNEEEFNLYIGSGYDQDYIDSIIGINSYRPDSGDFTNIFVSGLTLIFPYIVITLFIIFVWKLLKRIFK